MKKLMIMMAMLVALGGVNGSSLLAGEHGGTTVAQPGTAAVKEHGGAAMEGSHGHEAENLAVLREAAAALKTSRPDLAEKLEKIAKEEEK